MSYPYYGVTLGEINDKFLDTQSNSIKIISLIHYHTQEGKVYGFNNSTTISSGSSDYIQFTTPSEDVAEIHFAEIILEANGEKVKLKFIESPTIGSEGSTSITPFNYNRKDYSNDTGNVEIYSDPSSISDGTLLISNAIYGTEKGGKTTSVGAGANPKIQFNLKPSTDYIIEIANEGAAEIEYSLWSLYGEI